MRVAPQFGLRHGPSLAKSRYVSIIVGGDYWKQLAGDVLHCCTALPCFALGAASTATVAFWMCLDRTWTAFRTSGPLFAPNRKCIRHNCGRRLSLLDMFRVGKTFSFFVCGCGDRKI